MIPSPSLANLSPALGWCQHNLTMYSRIMRASECCEKIKSMVIKNYQMDDKTVHCKNFADDGYAFPSLLPSCRLTLYGKAKDQIVHKKRKTSSLVFHPSIGSRDGGVC